MSRLFNNTIFTFADYVILIGLNLLATPILIREFSIEGYGVFVFLSIFSIYGALSFFDLGMEGSLMYFVARFDAAGDRGKLQDSLSAALCYYGALGLVLGIIIYFSGGLITARLLSHNGELQASVIRAAIAFISVNIFVQFLTVPFSAILQGMRRFALSKTVNSIMNLLRYLLVIMVAIAYRRIDIAFAIILLLTFLRLAVFLAIFFVRLPEFKSMQWRLNGALLRTLFTYSSLLFVNRLIGLISNQIDKLLIWLYLAVSNMTVYDIVTRPANLLRLILTIMNSALVPETARFIELGDHASVKRLFISLVRYTYMLSVPLVALMYVFIDDLLRLWVGSALSEYGYMSMILLTAYLILPIPSIASTMVVGLGKVRETLWIPIATTILNVVLSWILLLSVGLSGLLIATLISELFALPLYVRIMKRTLTFTTLDLLRPLFPIFALGLVDVLLYHLCRRFLAFLPAAMIVGAAVIFVLSAAFTIKYLLRDDERAFVRDKFLRLRIMAEGSTT